MNQIIIKEGIVWEDGVPFAKQTSETREWISEEVLSKVKTQQPKEVDRFGRPALWEVQAEGLIITVQYQYIHESSSMAKESTLIEITKE